MDKEKNKGKTTVYKSLHRKLKIDQHELTDNGVVLSGYSSFFHN
jgi:hypothetical protein